MEKTPLVGNAIAWSKKQLYQQPMRPNVPYNAEVIFTPGGTEFSPVGNRFKVLKEFDASGTTMATTSSSDEGAMRKAAWARARGGEDAYLLAPAGKAHPRQDQRR